jgi:hypothetical protein
MLNVSKLLGLSLLALAASVLMVVGVALAALPPGGTFIDDHGNVHEANIEAIAAAGITKGCNPPANDRYCPNNSVTRGQMAAFLRRAFSLPASATDYFVDDSGSVFEGDINAVAEAGITKGCNPPENDRFCTDTKITRGQMAAFLRRAFDYPIAAVDHFTDDNASGFEADINAIAEAGVTKGCNPPANDRYCPDSSVTRGQMASFFTRALGLAPIVPPPPETSTTTTTTTTIAADPAPPPPPASEPPPSESGYSPRWPADDGGRQDVENWRSTVAEYWPADRVDCALGIILRESRGDPRAHNKSSNAMGLMQHLLKYWPVRAEGAGFIDDNGLLADPFNGEANIAAGAWLADYVESPKVPWYSPWRSLPDYGNCLN